MKSLLAIFILALQAQAALACGPLVQPYAFECALQDNYLSVTDSLKNDFGVEAEYTVAYRSLRLIEEDDYNDMRKQVSHMPWKIYEPTPTTWLYWERGAWVIDQMVADTTRKSLSMDDVEDINSALISKEMLTSWVRIKGNKPGRVRTGANFIPPGAVFKCDESPMSASGYEIIKNYDLKDFEGEALMRPKFKKCKDGGYHGQILYVGGKKVKRELQRWLDHFNLYLQKYLDGDQADLSPMEFIAYSQRWFLAIHPFGDGNGRTSRFIQDLFLKKLGLPYMPTGRISMLTTPDKYLISTKKEIGKSIKYLNSCLVNYQKRKLNRKKLIEGHCLPLYQDLDTGESQKLKNERLAFAKDLKDMIDELSKK